MQVNIGPADGRLTSHHWSRPGGCESAAPTGIGSGAKRKLTMNLFNKIQIDFQLLPSSGLLLTAVPAGSRWCLKAVDTGAGSTVRLPDCFGSRLEALGAGVLLAQHCNGRVIP